MSKNPVALKVAAPYARALLDFVNDTGTLFQVTLDLQTMQVLLYQFDEFYECLQNPLISGVAKQQILINVVRKNMSIETLKFLTTLIARRRINLLPTILFSYLELVYEAAGSRYFHITSAKNLSKGQRTRLIKKIRSVAKYDRITVEFSTDESLIGGFLIHNEGKVVDYTVKNKLKILAKQLDTVLEL